jgi:putative heme-binding domain-containing protein
MSADLTGTSAAADQGKLLTGLEEGLARNRGRKPIPAEGQKALDRLLVNSAPEMKPRVLHIAGLVRLKDSEGIRAVRTAALKTALDGERPIAERVAALSLLAGTSAADVAPLQALLGPRQPIELQEAAVRAIAAAEGPEVVPTLLKEWGSSTPRVQSAILDAICGRQDRLPALLDAVEKKIIDPSSLPPLRQTQLLENPEAKVRKRAKELLASRTTTADRQKVLERYREALTLKRDPRRGAEVFEQQCMKCHQLNGRGFAVGPDLAALQNRPDESLLVDVLDPSSTITVGFRTYLVVARNGKTYTGTLSAETATSITLQREKGEQDVILRRDIEEMTASSKSLMPEGIEKEISPQDMANLIGYLREALKNNAKEKKGAK